MPLPQQPQQPSGEAPARGGELLGALRSQNRELQRVRQELEATQAALKERAATAAPALTAAPTAVPALTAAPTPAPVAAPAVEAEEEEEGGSAFAALNLVGIIAAGGLIGYQVRPS